ncbi:hypothetical protein SAMN02745866_01450 [Alteromonadaceae bacterium Bs31]|nr:hypothetical protein SAMN02745866_01450 [Alteromonadaceae bacterium Bs31]
MKRVVSIVVLLSLVACDLQSEVDALSSMRDKELVWVFAQFNVREESDGLESYYYYGQVSKKLYQAVSYNEISSGFILLKNARYWGENDLIYEYKDIKNSGDIVFRIENIVKVELINVEPIAGKGYEQFEEPKDVVPDEPDQVPPTEQQLEGSPNRLGKPGSGQGLAG